MEQRFKTGIAFFIVAVILFFWGLFMTAWRYVPYESSPSYGQESTFAILALIPMLLGSLFAGLGAYCVNNPK